MILILLLSSARVFAAGSSTAEKMDPRRLREEAFARCQSPYEPPAIPRIPLLDPPADGAPGSVGMVYQEELAVRTRNLLDRDGFYFSPRPRAAVNTLPMEVFVDIEGTGVYRRRTWADANPDYSHPSIRPPISREQIPESGRVLTEVIIGHQSPRGDWPQLFDIRSSAYVRFAGYPPEVTGASMRLAAHRIFGRGAPGAPDAAEDFPIIRSIFLSVKDRSTANALILVESELFCGALDMDMAEGESAEITVDGHWYTRRDFDWAKDPHTGLIAYSSMLWKNERHTPWHDGDEAHDSDVLRVVFPGGLRQGHVIDVPERGLRVHEFGFPLEWSLNNEDRDHRHYRDFEPALGATNYPWRASYRVRILESNVRLGLSLYEARPDGEYGDNLVAVSTIRQDIRKARHAGESVHVKYVTTAFSESIPAR